MNRQISGGLSKGSCMDLSACIRGIRGVVVKIRRRGMKRLTFLLLVAMFALSCSVFAQDSAARKIIIDTDTGADDASAIILAASVPGIEIVGVTVLAGNVSLEQGTKNALAALEIAGCDAPVFKGSDTRYDGTTISPHSVFGMDGMGDMDLIHPLGKAQEGDAIDFILDTVRDNPGEIEIIMLGPATNIAKAMDKDPETMKKVKRIWSMGTSGINGPGNASPVAEFNVYLDAPAYKKLLDFDVPVTIIGLDVCDGDSKWNDENFKELTQSGMIGWFVADAFRIIREYYAKNGSVGSVMNCDGTAMMCVVYPDFVNDSRQCHGSCITEPGETYGQVLFYQKGFSYDMVSGDYDYNVTLICGVKREAFFLKYLYWISLLE